MSGANQEERQARSLALEKAYVHDVYDHFSGAHFNDTRYRPWPRVRQFLMELEPGSLVADVGCGSGKYLDINPDLMKIGCDRCAPLTSAARAKNLEVLTCDNLHMPFRDETFDAVLSVAVVHHFATTDRRVAAIKELTRVLRIGGKVLITVWAMEQRHRKFDSQDVLVPWHEPVKSSSEDHASSVEREVTSTTSDDDILVYHAYSHISDNEKQGSTVNRKRQKYRNGRGRYRSADNAVHCKKTTGTSSQSSSELSSPNETCYSFVRRAFQKLSNSSPTSSPYDTFAKRPNSRTYFYRSCRKPCVSESMEFGKYGTESGHLSPKNEFGHQDSLESEYPDQPTTDDDIPIELRHLEGYDTCKKCGSPTAEFSGFGNCENQICTSCLPADPEPGKKSRSLGDFLNMIPKLLRVKKCEKEPLSDLHKRISTASDPREYVVKTRGGDVNGIVRSKSTVSMMSRLEELMSMSQVSDRDETVANPNCSAGPRSRTKPSMFQSFTSSTVLYEGSDGTIGIRDEGGGRDTGRRYNSPADALQKLRQDVSLDEPFNLESAKKCNDSNNTKEKDDDVLSPTVEKKLQNSELLVRRRRSSIKTASSLTETKHPETREDTSPDGSDNKGRKSEKGTERHLSSYYSMPELYKLTQDSMLEEKPVLTSQKERHISFYEQAQNIFADNSSESPNDLSRRHESTLNYTVRERCNIGASQRGLVKRSLSVDTGDNSSSSHHVPRRFSASAAQGVLASALRTYSLPRSCSRGSSVKSDTSVDSEESIVSVIPRKGNSITSDTSVDSEESVISVIQRSTSEFETLGSQNGLRNNISRFGSRSAQASPVTVLSSQTSSAESSPPQSGKTDGRFPGSSAVIDQLLQQQQLLYSPSEGGHSELSIRTRRCLLRPISDPKIEEKFSSSNHSEDFSNSLGTRQSSIPKSNQGSLELVEESKTVIKENSILTKTNCSQNGMAKPSTSEMTVHFKSETANSQEGELSRTPSPVGPFQYITDPLITGIESNSVPVENAVSSTTNEPKTKSFCFNAEVTNFEVKKTLSVSEILKPPNGLIDLLLKNATIRKDENKISKDSKPSTSFFEDSNDTSCSNVTNTDASASSKVGSLVKSDSTSSEDSTKSKKDSDMRKSFFNLRERLESLASSQSSSLDIFKNVGHSFGSLKNIKEKLDSDSSNESFKENKVSPTPKSLNDSRQSSLDESSQVTLSDESVMSVEGTSSETDYKKTDEEDENAESSQNITVKKVEEEKIASPPLNVLTEVMHQKNFQMKKFDTSAGKCGSEHHKPSKASSFSDTELHVKKGGARCALRKRLRRSCVTIDEVECREFVSSEDTSPSSSLSLEWNDFDKIDTDSSSYVACCNGGITTIPEDDIYEGGEPSIEICCDDVNVAEMETKFNIVDKEMCVFFETPSSSIGKSASSSSNATDFSTTSDRFRGIMQREKSDDRSSKESDSDNLSKLSDVEGRSDSAFSEDFARRCDFASSSSSASMDALDSVRVKLSNEAECDGATSCSKQISSWVLDNIDEIPDDEKNHDEKLDPVLDVEKSPIASTSANWKPERSMDFAQRKENFFSSAADCRDMYRISFDSKSKGDKNGRPCPQQAQKNSATNSHSHDLVPMGMIMPDLAPDFLDLFPHSRRVQDENEAPTDILAAFVETISDITSAFGELYPRKDTKIEEASSDESISVGISTFERVLTSSVASHSKNRLRKSLDHQKEKSSNDDSPEIKTSNRKSSNGNVSMTPTNLGSVKSDLQNIGQTFVKLPPEDDLKPYSTDTKSSEINPEISKDTADPSHPDSSETPNSERKLPEKLKTLNRASQSVCLDRVRQSSIEKDDEQSTQSAPCSPRMKPRQRSVEEVMTSSRNELSRNSSLSQSTSQESLPGNETGGMMSYHRYYHVFRQGELDSLIENHVDNLHILSSYYDHANWCIVAEKVQVWTI